VEVRVVVEVRAVAETEAGKAVQVRAVAETEAGKAVEVRAVVEVRVEATAAERAEERE
jgi:hypothetical protein